MSANAIDGVLGYVGLMRSLPFSMAREIFHASLKRECYRWIATRFQRSR